MRILFDQNMPVGVRKFLRRAGHEVVTSPELEWEELKNGVLLKAEEEAHFDLMITADQNLSYQQNLKERRIALIVPGPIAGHSFKSTLTKLWLLLRLQKLTAMPSSKCQTGEAPV